jgi:hypothetical protein
LSKILNLNTAIPMKFIEVFEKCTAFIFRAVEVSKSRNQQADSNPELCFYKTMQCYIPEEGTLLLLMAPDA